MHFSQPDAAPATTARQQSLIGLPLAGICCLALVLLAITSVIVLALIPVYLPRKDVIPARSPVRYFTADLSGSPVDDTVLDAASRNNLANALAKANGLPSGSISVNKASIATTSGRRRREKSRNRIARRPTNQGRQLIFGEFTVVRTVCNPCIINVLTFTEPVTIFIGGIPFTFVVSFLVTETAIVVPPILAPSTIPPTVTGQVG